MIIDVGELGPAAALNDVIIVGSGVNGTVLAAELDRAGFRVLLLEAGGDDEGSRLSADVAGLPFEGANAGRRAGFGGSGAWWAGQCAPFDPIDFEDRPWVPASGWPLSAEDVAPWYEEAAKVLGIPGETFGEEHWLKHRVVPVRLDGLHHKFSAFIPRPNIAKELRGQLARSKNTTVALRAPVVEVRRSTGGRVDGVVVSTGAGERRLLRSRNVILAGGGIETPRLLLASRTDEPDGLANRSGNVGRYLHDHPNGIAARVLPYDSRRMQDLYGLIYTGRARHWARIPLPADVQRREHLVNATANVVFEYPGDGAVESLKRVVRQQIQRRPLERRPSMGDSLRTIATALPAVPAVLWRRYGRGLSPSQPAADTWLQTAAEQPPRADSRVVLSSRTDENGMPLAEVHWVLGLEERDAQRALVQAIGAAWQAAGIAQVEPLPWLLADGDGWRSHQVDAYHHSGTARMSTSASSGVVDRNLECHEVPGLFVAGSAVFPTSSHWNPTFTSVALSLRLADRLKRVMS